MKNKWLNNMDPHLAADMQKAAEVMRRGGVILYPTDTIWGLGCDACNSAAVERIYRIKQREDSKALITLVPDPAWLENYVELVPEVAWQLIDVAVNPLTIVYDKGVNVAQELLAPDGSIGIRVTSEPYSSGLCRLLKRPIVSTSANISGQKPAAIFPEISQSLIDAVDYVADWRRDDTAKAQPSSVIKLGRGGLIQILR